MQSLSKYERAEESIVFITLRQAQGDMWVEVVMLSLSKHELVEV